MTPVEALDRLKASGLAMGPDWEAVHNACQAREGDTVWDWIHALCHRIEGDEWNADYWYRACGRKRHSDDLADEWAHLRRSVGEAG